MLLAYKCTLVNTLHTHTTLSEHMVLEEHLLGVRVQTAVETGCPHYCVVLCMLVLCDVLQDAGYYLCIYGFV
jgi:hypothetical protein